MTGALTYAARREHLNFSAPGAERSLGKRKCSSSAKNWRRRVV
jgi:hypothetical protein